MADFTLNSLRGGINNTDPPISLPVDQVVDARNVERSRTTLGRRRLGCEPIDLSVTLAACDSITFLHRHYQSGDGSDATLWVLGIDGSNPVLEYKDTTWHSVTPNDAITITGSYQYAMRGLSLHGKIFLAYKSGVDRLHVYDGTTFRRTGLAAPAAAPTAANSGGVGTLVGTRYYRVRFVELSGSTILRRSEPSAVLTFAPSGTNASITVTKPATVSEGETHWELEASTGDDNYYRIARTVVGTTTYVDSQDYVTGYAAVGTLSETSGDYTNLRSARYLTADNDRLIFAGSFEDPESDSIVGWTPVNNATGVGNDERNPVATTNYLNLDGRLGGRIVGMTAPINGYIYAFKNERIYKLVRTGVLTKAYEAVLLTDKRGAIEGSVVEGVDQKGKPCVYFIDPKVGACMIGASGLVQCGDDIFNTFKTLNQDATLPSVSLFYSDKKQVHWWIATGSSNVPDTHLVLQTNEIRDVEDGVRRGWDIWDGESAAALCALMYADNIDDNTTRSEAVKPFIGMAATDLLAMCDKPGVDTDNGTAYHAYQVTKPFAPAGILNQAELKSGGLLGIASNGTSVEVTATANFGLFEKSATADFTPESTETHVIAMMDDLDLGEITTLQLKFEDATPSTGTWDLHQFALRQEAGQRQARSRA